MAKGDPATAVRLQLELTVNIEIVLVLELATAKQWPEGENATADGWTPVPNGDPRTLLSMHVHIEKMKDGIKINNNKRNRLNITAPIGKKFFTI